MPNPTWIEGTWDADMVPVLPANLPSYIFVCVYGHWAPVLRPMHSSELARFLCERGREELSHNRPLPRWNWRKITAPEIAP